MNYQKIHDFIINRSKNRILTGFKEKHHIIPRCMGGDNSKENIAVLTPKEHYIIHYLLIKIYPSNSKLIYAFWMMCNRSKSTEYRFVPSVRSYNYARELYSKIDRRGSKNSNYNNRWSDAQKKHLSDVCTGIKKNITEGHKNKLRNNIRKAAIVSQTVGKSRCNISSDEYIRGINVYNLQNELLKEYTSIRHVIRENPNFKVNSVLHACQGKTKTYMGFVWKYFDKQKKEVIKKTFIKKAKANKKNKEIKILFLETNEIKSFVTQRELSKFVGVTETTICDYISGRTNSIRKLKILQIKILRNE
jgi:hypothetical protein